MYENCIEKISNLIYENYTAENFSSLITKNDNIDSTLKKFNLDYSYDNITKTLSIFDETNTIKKNIRLMTDKEYMKKLEVKYEKIFKNNK